MSRVLPYTTIFPLVVRDIFARCITHPGLRHSVLCISSMIADHWLKRPMDRFHFQYITSLQKIQHAIRDMFLDEPITIAVFFILWIDAIRGDLWASRKHARGLYLILQELQKRYRQSDTWGDQDPQILIDESGSTVGITTLIMQIWRMAIRVDVSTSMFLVQRPVFPSVAVESQDLHRNWIRDSTPDHGSTEWALATFALDNLLHRACHVACQARTMRRSPSYNPDLEFQILQATNELAHQNREWFQRVVVRAAEANEQAAQLDGGTSGSTAPDFSDTFLEFPRRLVKNVFYANLVMYAYAVSIYISLIAYPKIGSTGVRQRYSDAVEMCKILASLGEGSSEMSASSRVLILFLVGVAFGGLRQSRRETEFVKARVTELVRMFPLMKDAVAAYQAVWEGEGDFWDAMDDVQQALC